MRMRGGFYSVIQDNTDFMGMGEYLHRYKCATYQEAKAYLEQHPKCTHIDYFDGEEWHHNVTEEMLPRK